MINNPELAKALAANTKDIGVETAAMLMALSAVLVRAGLTTPEELCQIREASRAQVLADFADAKAPVIPGS